MCVFVSLCWEKTHHELIANVSMCVEEAITAQTENRLLAEHQVSAV